MNATEARTLYAYDRWANRRLLDAVSTLPPDMVEREVGISHQSLIGTLRHILWGEWRWLGRWQEGEPGGPTPLESRDLAALRARWTEIERELKAFVDRLEESDLERVVSYENPPGTRWTYTLGQTLQHVGNHSTYHRGQIAGLLRQLGTEPPPTDFLVMIDELGGAASP